MFGYISAFECKMKIFQRDITTTTFKYFPKLKSNYKEVTDAHDDDLKHDELLFLSSLDDLKDEFSTRFSQFREFEENLYFIKYPDKTEFVKMNMNPFEWLKIDDFEIELI